MRKSGLIFSVVAILFGIGLSLLSPICVPCLAVFLGLGAGYLAGVFDKPVESSASGKSGAIAGVIGGVGALLGQGIGSVINASIVGPERAVELIRQLGVPTSSVGSIQSGYWGGLIGVTCCAGLLDVVFMAGLGALGGILWWQFVGKNSIASKQIISA
jgi:hypothetical protein